MSEAIIEIDAAGPHTSVQDGGRPGLMRFGVPASGPMDRLAFAVANAALGNPAGAPALEVSAGGVALRCVAGTLSFAVAGGSFIVEQQASGGMVSTGSWTVAAISAGERLVIRAGPWGSWTYLAFAGTLRSAGWLGSASTHALSGFGGGRIAAGQRLTIDGAERRSRREGALACPVSARPRAELRVVMGPQDRFFSAESLRLLTTSVYTLSDAYDRMGVRLRGPAIAPHAPLDMPSEALLRGSVQVAGDGAPTILLADHQTTGGYPKIATVIDPDMDGLAQLRPRSRLSFVPITPEQAVMAARRHAERINAYLDRMTERGSATS